MKSRKLARGRSSTPADAKFDDGEFVLRAAPSRAAVDDNRKARPLCRQVADTLGYVLTDGADLDLLSCLRVVDVVPAPNSARLLVTVTSDVPLEEFDQQAIADYLARQTGRLRSEIAASINRRHLPLLVFHVAGPLKAAAGE